ncbi:dynein axonemal assembly factor 1 homolog [Cylas formicarius]|uniref:dynein axonemal assembly factor 1 homolog n=1 Tax=Cylas formicarius TaxID=197179 RepID=UPI00295894AF|nr:dynein axonemal assembly factor 1 homolog [Cylas formicarius]
MSSSVRENRDKKEYNALDEICKGPRMTKEFIRKQCKEQKLYQTPHLNDVLYLHFKGFSYIENLEEYTGLKCLWLENNGIREISGLDQQTELRSLFLHYNLIKRIENLEKCSLLDTLNLSYNQVRKIENLDCIKTLHTLNLSHNYVESYDDFVHLEKLSELSVLDLANNHIADPLIVQVLGRMADLRVVNLMGNPVIRKIPAYRKTTILACKNLQYLDDRPVFPKERACAEAWERGGLTEERAERQRWVDRERAKIMESVRGLTRIRNANLAARRQDSSKSDSGFCTSMADSESDEEVIDSCEENSDVSSQSFEENNGDSTNQLVRLLEDDFDQQPCSSGLNVCQAQTNVRDVKNFGRSKILIEEIDSVEELLPTRNGKDGLVEAVEAEQPTVGVLEETRNGPLVADKNPQNLVKKNVDEEATSCIAAEELNNECVCQHLKNNILAQDVEGTEQNSLKYVEEMNPHDLGSKIDNLLEDIEEPVGKGTEEMNYHLEKNFVEYIEFAHMEEQDINPQRVEKKTDNLHEDIALTDSLTVKKMDNLQEKVVEANEETIRHIKGISNEESRNEEEEIVRYLKAASSKMRNRFRRPRTSLTIQRNLTDTESDYSDECEEECALYETLDALEAPYCEAVDEMGEGDFAVDAKTREDVERELPRPDDLTLEEAVEDRSYRELLTWDIKAPKENLIILKPIERRAAPDGKEEDSSFRPIEKEEEVEFEVKFGVVDTNETEKVDLIGEHEGVDNALKVRDAISKIRAGMAEFQKQFDEFSERVGENTERRVDGKVVKEITDEYLKKNFEDMGMYLSDDEDYDWLDMETTDANKTEESDEVDNDDAVVNIRAMCSLEMQMAKKKFEN